MYMELLSQGHGILRRERDFKPKAARHVVGAQNETARAAKAPAKRKPHKESAHVREVQLAPELTEKRSSGGSKKVRQEPLQYRVVDDTNSTFAAERPPPTPLPQASSLAAGPATVGLRCANCLLAAAACVLIYYSRVRPTTPAYTPPPGGAAAAAAAAATGSGGLRTKVLGFESGFQMSIFTAYVAFSCAHMFLQRRAGSTGYSVVSATIVIYSLKCLCALLMYVCKGGRDFRALLEAGGGARFGRVPACVLTLIPGGCLGCYDALSFLSLAALDPVTYQIVLHLRLVFVALLWQFTFKRQLTSTQWFALLLFAAASMTKGLEQIGDVGPAVHHGLLIMLVQILMAVGGNVMAECLLKEVPIATDLLNTCLYFEGLVVLLIVVCVTQGGPSAVHSTLLAPMAWKELISDPWMVSSIVCMVMFGIVTAYFLRELSNLLKELSACFVIVVSAAVEWGLLGSSSCSTLGLQAVVLAILAVGVYNAEPLDNKAKQPPAESAPGYVRKQKG